jgi:phosphoglycerol transferase MdoB-like AlkP superfamily enzyme
MTENENVVKDNTVDSGVTFGAKVKEYFRKKVVNLKRKPQNIPLIVLLATSVYYMLILFVLSKSIDVCAENSNVPAGGICVFITTLLSLLSLVSFLNAFPKRKKPNIAMIVVVFVMIAVMIVCDILYYVQISNYLKYLVSLSSYAEASADPDYITAYAGLPYVIGHIALLAASAVIFALLPVIKILVNKIDTSVKLESATENMNGKIDIVD